MYAAITDQPLDPADILARTGDDADGAVLLFLGVVRDHADGRPVTGMTYEAYREMAEPVLHEIALETAARLGTDRVALAHRVGDLAVGDVSVAIAVSSPHRAEAYDASRHAIETLKRRLPVWKREHYADGDSEWVSGVDPRTGRAAADTSREVPT